MRKIDLFNEMYIIVLLALFVTIIPTKNLASPLLTPPSLETDDGMIKSDLSTQSYSLDNFRITWKNTANGSKLIVQHDEKPQRILWSSVPGLNFVQANASDIVYRETRGSFWLDNNELLFECDIQSVERIVKNGSKLELHGHLGNGNSVIGCGTRYKFTLYSPESDHLKFDVSISEGRCLAESCDHPPLNETELLYSTTPNEEFYGFGEQYTHFNLKGHKFSVLSEEQGLFRGDQPWSMLVNMVAPGSAGNDFASYKGVPYYMTSKNRSLFLENSEYAIFDLHRPNVARIRLLSSDMSGRILYGADKFGIIEAYTKYAGRMRPLPNWVNTGAIVGMQGGTKDVREKWKLFREHNTPLAAFWLQDWVGQRETMLGDLLWWNWTLDKSRYPNWKQLVSDMNNSNVRVMGYINSMLSDPSVKENLSRNLYKEAKEKGYLVKNEHDEIFKTKLNVFYFSFVDLSNPDAREWYKNVIKEEMIEIGFDGWMADFGEALPLEGIELHSGTEPATYHNQYLEEWAKLNREVIREVDREDDITFFMRGAYTRSPRWSTMFWEGDQMTTWDRQDGFKSAIIGLMSSGLSGFSINHSDIGGYAAASMNRYGVYRTKELLLRWMEANAFTAVFRSHEGNAPNENYQVYSDSETLSAFSKFAHVYKGLAPYRRKLMKQAKDKGYPVVRHPMLHYPNDPDVPDLRYQYMLGADFMVAPVVNPNVSKRTLYLPDDEWIHLWSGKSFEGGREITIQAPIGKPPVFYKANSTAGKNLVQKLKAQELL